MIARLRLRLPYKQWLRVVESGAMPGVREWLAECERKIDEAADDFWSPVLHGTGDEARPFEGLAPRYPAPPTQYGVSPGRKAIVTFRALSGESDPP